MKTETNYLKEDLGPALAKGLAATAIARPQNPTEYLALWLLHYLQQRRNKAQEVTNLKEVEGEREAWGKGRATREKSASIVIQREWMSHVHAVEDSKRKEAELRAIFGTVEETLEERVPEEPSSNTDEGRSDKEKQAEVERLTSCTQFRRSKLFVAELNKAHIATFKLLTDSPINAPAQTLLKCCLYAQGHKPKAVNSFDKIKSLIKPFPFSEWLHSFDPIGVPLQKKRMMSRVRRLLTTIDDADIKSLGPVLYSVFNWLNTASLFRHYRDEHVKVRKAGGKEADEEYEEEDMEDGAAADGAGGEDNKDPAEEVVKAAELEALKQLEEELAAAQEGAAPVDGNEDL